jgi:hypothetical protein
MFVSNILPLGQITHPILTRDISVGILIFEYKVNLISLIECKDGVSTTDIICACLLFSAELSKRSGKINEIQGTILALKEYASDLQTFLLTFLCFKNSCL